LSLTPVSADLKVGGQHETGVAEDNMVKVQTGDSSNVEYVADTVEQTYQEIQEYPLWLVIAFALCCPSPFPSPMAAWANRKRRVELEATNKRLVDALAKSQPLNEGATHG
jgi:hypothetical protein